MSDSLSHTADDDVEGAAGLLAAAWLAGYRAERIHQHPALSASLAELRADSAAIYEAGGPATAIFLGSLQDSTR